MSNASPFESDSGASVRRRLTVESLQSICVPAAQFVGFWSAVVLPFVLVSLLASGFAAQSPQLVGGLLVCNVVGLILGRNYSE